MGDGVTTLVVGTDKGGWLLRTDDREHWEIEGPFFSGWKVSALGRANDGTYLAGTASGWFGPAIHRSTDLESWEQVTPGPEFGSGGPRLQQIWSFMTTPEGRLYCGVAEAGLFFSDDNGVEWHPVEPFNDHPTRPLWSRGGAGMCVHHVLVDGDRIWVAASAIGVFRSDDGGKTFVPRSVGVERTVPGDEPGIGYCVQSMVAHPSDPDRIWRQDRMGLYRTADGGDTWENIEHGLPGRSGFPVVRDNSTGNLFVVPLISDQNRLPVEGRFAAYRSVDDGDSWSPSGKGWPEEPTYTQVLRRAVVTGHDDSIYLGTTSGEVWATFDGGDTWGTLPGRYPRIAHLALW